MLKLQHYFTDQWAAVLASAIQAFRAGELSPQWWHETFYSGRWKAYCPTGRGHGRVPDPPLRDFRGNHCKYNPLKIGAKQMRLFQEKGTNSCQHCGSCYGNDDITPLDYLTFYKTGEVFSWVDPLWLAGFIPFDPRECHQPEESLFMTRWVCHSCWASAESELYDRHRSSQLEKRYARSFRKNGTNRVLEDRRTAFEAWSNVNMPDRRVATRRVMDKLDPTEFTMPGVTMDQLTGLV